MDAGAWLVGEGERDDKRCDAPRAARGSPWQVTVAGRADMSRTDDSHVTLHRCDAAKRRRNEPQLSNVPEQVLCAGFRVKRPAPGKVASFSGKPRNSDEGIHAHACYLGPDGGFFKASRSWPIWIFLFPPDIWLAVRLASRLMRDSV
jgi:hypothetical protein